MGYVKDLVNGTILAMENENAIGEIINIGNNEELSVLETANLIHRIANTGFKLKLRFVPFHEVFGGYKDITRRVPDLTKAKRLIGYEPKVKLIDAIEFTIKSIMENQKELSENSYFN
jgi:UDP-glucose 4-epimerase